MTAQDDAKAIRDALHDVEAATAKLHKLLARGLFKHAAALGIDKPGDVHTNAGGTGKTPPQPDGG